jgi:hypothetical protein
MQFVGSQTHTTPHSRMEKWEDVYRRAVLEMDGRKMPERVADARQAICDRMQRLAGDGNGGEERRGMQKSLRPIFRHGES